MEMDVCDDSSRLLAGELVEVRKAGTRPCWRPGKVVEVRDGVRIVEYDDDPGGGKEFVNFEALRPKPPVCSTVTRGDWQRGLRVEALGGAAWREGVLLDAPGVFSTHAQVFFPDSADKQDLAVESLRVSQSWDAARDAWTVRGSQALAGVVEVAKPPKTFQRKKKRKDSEKLEVEVAKKMKKEIEIAAAPAAAPITARAVAPVAAPAAMQIKQEVVSDGIQLEAEMMDVKAEALDPDWMEETESRPDSLRTFQPGGGGGGDEHSLTRTLSIPVCCVNTQVDDALFADEHRVADDEKSYSDLALCTMDTSSQGSFHSAQDANHPNANLEQNKLALARVLKKQKIPVDYSRREESLKAARENAIKNLEDSGWKKGYRERHRESRVSNEAYYISPDGTSYHSLTSACKAWMQQNKDVAKSVRDAMNSYQLQIIVRRRPGDVLPESNGGKRKVKPSRKVDPLKKSRKSERPRLNALLLTPNRAQQNEVNKRMTVLSWLIDGEIVPDGAAVSCSSRVTDSVSTGVITREGICCNCCSEIFSMGRFQIHAGNNVGRTAAELVLEDGRSLLDCQKQALKKIRDARSDELANGQVTMDESDECCGLCAEGGELICCDHCPATFHLHCILLKSLPEGDWFCPRCRCPVCGAGQFDGREVLYCAQCERSYHVDCLNNGGSSVASNRFCSQSCHRIFCGLRGLVGRTCPMDGELSWTLLRSAELDEGVDLEAVTEQSSKLSIALSMMRECFSPMIDPRRKIDIIAHILKNRSADVKRLDFRNFYTILLENSKEEVISVAAIRVHGTSIAEMPLIGTRLQYRRQGMCRRLLEVIEQVLRSLNVHTLVLPAVPELLDTWIGAFGFQKVSPFQSVRLMELSIVGFPGTKVLQKPLTWLNLCRKIAPPLAERPWIPGSKLHMGLDPEPHRKPKPQKPPPPKPEDLPGTPLAVLPDPGSGFLLPQAERDDVPGLREEQTEDSRIVVAKTRSNRLVRAPKRVVEAWKTLTNRKFQRPEAAAVAAEITEEAAETGTNNSELSLLEPSHIALNNAEMAAVAAPPTASGSEIVELASSNTEAREEHSDAGMVPVSVVGDRGDDLVVLSRIKGKKCITCGTSETPMWRKDPGGIKHLCNACGIRSKKQRMAAEQNLNSGENFNWELEEEEEEDETFALREL